jgi:hypothetical protein
VRKRLNHLPVLLGVSALVMAVAVLVGAVSGGATVALGAAAGVGLVVFSYGISSVIIAWTDLVMRPMILPVGLATYLIKFSAFGGLLIVVTRSKWDGAIPMACGIIAGVVAWVATQAVWVYRSRIPYVDLTEAKGGAGS